MPLRRRLIATLDVLLNLQQGMLDVARMAVVRQVFRYFGIRKSAAKPGEIPRQKRCHYKQDGQDQNWTRGANAINRRGRNLYFRVVAVIGHCSRVTSNKLRVTSMCALVALPSITHSVILIVTSPATCHSSLRIDLVKHQIHNDTCDRDI